MAKSDSENDCTVRDMEIFNNIQNFIRTKINNGNNNFSGDDYDSPRKEVYNLIRSSVEMHESNSAIICGPPGCGKTAVRISFITRISLFNFYLYSLLNFSDAKKCFERAH